MSAHSLFSRNRNPIYNLFCLVRQNLTGESQVAFVLFGKSRADFQLLQILDRYQGCRDVFVAVGIPRDVAGDFLHILPPRSRSSDTHFDQESQCLNMRRLAAGMLACPLIMGVGRQARVDAISAGKPQVHRCSIRPVTTTLGDCLDDICRLRSQSHVGLRPDDCAPIFANDRMVFNA
ncbi:MAG: hypothetical protein ABSD75_13935 [Terriglobales bacterium]